MKRIARMVPDHYHQAELDSAVGFGFVVGLLAGVVLTCAVLVWWGVV